MLTVNEKHISRNKYEWALKAFAIIFESSISSAKNFRRWLTGG